MSKTYIWSIYTRVFHLLLVIAVLGVFLSSDEDSLLGYHAVFGYFIVILLLYRVIWGFMDVKYSKFKDFNFSFKELFLYFINIFTNKKEYAGHNPASSWAIVSMIALASISVVSGILTYGVQEGMGLVSFLNNSMFKDMEFFEDIHEFFANLFMFVIFVHIAGVVLDKILHKSLTMESMIYGYKNSNAKDLKLSLVQHIFGIIWIGSSVFLFVYLLSTPENILIADGNEVINYEKEHKLFYDECKSCHMLYPPFLLPKNSWVSIMNNLENHFGDDASLEDEDILSIREYLSKNSAESSTKEVALKILKYQDNPDNITITKTPYFKKKHKNIDKKNIENKKVGKISNCKGCHSNIETGILKKVQDETVFNAFNVYNSLCK